MPTTAISGGAAVRVRPGRGGRLWFLNKLWIVKQCHSQNSWRTTMESPLSHFRSDRLAHSFPYPRKQIWRFPRAPGWRSPPAARLRGEPEQGGGTSCRWGGWRRSWVRGGWWVEERRNNKPSVKIIMTWYRCSSTKQEVSQSVFGPRLCAGSQRPQQLNEGPCATSPSHKVTAASKGVKAAQQAASTKPLRSALLGQTDAARLKLMTSTHETQHNQSHSCKN